MQCLPKIFKYLAYSRSVLLPSVEKSNRFIYCTSTAPQFAESLSKDFKTLKDLWDQKRKSDDVDNFLFKCFSRETDSYSFALDMMKYISSQDSERIYDLVFVVILAFDTWLKKNSVCKPLTLDVKREALEMTINSKHRSLTIMLSKVYRVQEDSAILKEYAEKLINLGMFDKACVCIITLGIQNEIPFEKILVPLALREKTHLILKYLEGNVDLQVKFVQTLDAMIPDPIQGHPLTPIKRSENKKLLNALSVTMKALKLSPELVPNMLKSKAAAMMNFLLYRKFQKLTYNGPWESMISDVVRQYPDLQKRLVHKLVLHKECDIASEIAAKFNISIDQTLEDLKKTSEGSWETLEENLSEEKPGNDMEQYLTLDLDKVEIQFVHSKDEFFSCLNDISQNHKVVGMDSEWKPQYGLQPTRLSLVQLAVSDKVYLLDMLSLGDCLSQEDWSNFMDLLFSNPNVLKLGCGIVQDVQMLVDDHRGPPQKRIKFSHMLDVAILFEEVRALYQEELEEFASDAPGTKSLSKLCKIVLGKHLDKGERICDWEIRPLTDSQMTYAALDANCLLQMVEKMQTRSAENSVDFEQAMATALDYTTDQSKLAWKNKKAYKWERQVHSFSFQPSISINSFSVVVDKSLATLAMKLRIYGANVRILTEEETCADGIKIAREENRFYLTAEDHHQEVEAALLNDKFYLVSEWAKHDERTLAFIFQVFNVHVASKAIFSRCMNCNGDDFLNIPSNDLKSIWETALSKDPKSENCSPENPDANNKSYKYQNTTVGSDGRINSGVKIQLNSIPSHVFSSVQSFEICKNCGNIHYQR